MPFSCYFELDLLIFSGFKIGQRGVLVTRFEIRSERQRNKFHKGDETMEKTKQVPNEILNAATAVLSPYFQELTPEELLKALETYNMMRGGAE